MSPSPRFDSASLPEILNFPIPVSTLASFFSARRLDAYLVGGVVRDALLARHTNDIDIALLGDAIRVGKELASVIGGHFVVLDEGRRIARIVLAANGGYACIDLAGFDSSIGEDLGRRDFTVDAMAFPLSLNNASTSRGLIDLFNGRDDLEKRSIRSVSPTAFSDDSARLMRGPRLAVQLGFSIERETAARIRENARLVASVAPERIRDELLKLLKESGGSDSIRLLDQLGLLFEVIPELEDAREVAQPREHYWDVLNHLIETVGYVERVLDTSLIGKGFVADRIPRIDNFDAYFSEQINRDLDRATLLKLVGLLHDISKPATKTVEDSGRIRFLGHHSEGAEASAQILQRLRFSRRAVEIARLMVQNHLRPTQMAQKGEMPSGKAIFRYFRDVGSAAIDTVYLNMADYLAARGPMLTSDEWNQHCRLMGYILDEGLGQKTPERLTKLLDGRDIMETFGLNPGRQVGHLLNLLREAQANGEVANKQQALELVRANLEMGDGSA